MLPCLYVVAKTMTRGAFLLQTFYLKKENDPCIVEVLLAKDYNFT